MSYKGIMVQKHSKNSISLISIIKLEVGFKNQIPTYLLYFATFST